MNSTAKLPIINRNDTPPAGANYEVLWQEALAQVARFSGQVWTNYNQSDPGITLLQSLVYAQVELGMKASLPMAQLLAQPNGTIDYHNQFVPPQQALTTNPVTAQDFRTLLLNQLPQIRNVQISQAPHSQNPYSLPLFTVQLQTIPPLLPASPAEIAPNTLTHTPPAATNHNLVPAAMQVLRQHGNIGQAFAMPTITPSHTYYLQGTIDLAPQVVPEQYVAQMLYQLNNHVCAFAQFQDLAQQEAQGLHYGQIFNGPPVSHGFVANPHTTPPRNQLSLNEAEAQILDLPGTLSLHGFALHPSHPAPAKPTPPARLAPNHLPVFNWHSLQWQKSNGLHLVQNQSPVHQLSMAKVALYYEQLLPAAQNLGALVPAPITSTYANIEPYYSIQNHLPPQYQLLPLAPNASLSTAHKGKIKQLKGFLALAEQVLANFLSQTAHLGHLFNFESGRSPVQVVAQTYFDQGLFSVPGIEHILVGAQQSIDPPPPGLSVQEAWEQYQKNPLTHYRRLLDHAQESTNHNLSRKQRVMRHLLARFGQQYSNRALGLTNPNFGTPANAEVWHISQQLKSFALNSQNQTRTYFFWQSTEQVSQTVAWQAQKHPASPPASPPSNPELLPPHLYSFASGVERNVETQLNLRAFYQGLIDSLQGNCVQSPDTVCAQVQPHGTHKNSFTVHIQQQETLLMDFTDSQDWQLLDPEQACKKAPQNTGTPTHLLLSLTQLATPYTNQLATLCKQFMGFLFIDPYRLLAWLPTANSHMQSQHLEAIAVFPGFVSQLNSPDFKNFLASTLQTAMPGSTQVNTQFENQPTLQNLIENMQAWQQGLLLQYHRSYAFVQQFPNAQPPSPGTPAQKHMWQVLQQAQAAAQQLWQYVQQVNIQAAASSPQVPPLNPPNHDW